MTWQVPTTVLIALLIIGSVVTLLNVNRSPADTLTVALGIQASSSNLVKKLDEATITAYERGRFSKELRQRLNKPSRTIELSSFLVDACEVSQRQWEQFVEWTKKQPGFEASSANDWLASKSTGHRIAGRMSSPASGVNFKGASSYCTAAGGRLPFAEEFEAMASGTEATLYPWGNEFTDSAWPYNSSERNASQACGAHPETTTASGIHDLASNTMEWGQGTMYSHASAFQPSIHGAPAARRTQRELYALNAAWLLGTPSMKSHHLGFRCVYGQHPLVLPWQRRVQEVVNVEGGTYTLGLPEESHLPLFLANMPPIREINLRNILRGEDTEPRFLTVDRCEVTRDAFAKFLSDPLVQLGMFSNEHQPADIDYTPLYWAKQLQKPELPVYGANWWAADAFARWSGGRLPTVEEWHQLAAGTTGSIYPWGTTFAADAAQTGDDAAAKLSQCGLMTRDRNAAGVSDLAGNLSEWTRSLSAKDARLSMWVQGGNWLLPGEETAKSLFGRPVPLTHRSKSIGLRVVYDG